MLVGIPYLYLVYICVIVQSHRIRWEQKKKFIVLLFKNGRDVTPAAYLVVLVVRSFSFLRCTSDDLHMFKFMIILTSCFMIDKAHRWVTFHKLG
jgi:hypothetical protein